MAREADLVIFVGGLNKNHAQDCEAGDREEYGLPFGQPRLIEELAKACPNIVVTLLSGNAVEMPWAKEVPAILQAWYLGTMTGKVVGNVLSGAVNPSGKLPFSFPARLEDCGAHSFGATAYPGDSIKEQYLEDIFVGYRWHDTKKIPAAYPFGYGLSYTTFEVGKATASADRISPDGTITVSVPVKNTGKVAGKETLQLYISDLESSLPRPVKELKAFEKVSLAPGEEKVVTFTITPEMLKFYSPEQKAWIAEPGKFKALVGTSSTDIKASHTFTL